MKNIRNNRGITLIALVITIIVLLILAAVSIATLTGDNGILTQAGNAKDKTTEATAIEKVQVEVLGSYDDSGKINIEQLNKNLKNINGLTYNGSALSDSNAISQLPATVTVDGYDIVIDGKGNVKQPSEIVKAKTNGTVFSSNTTITDDYGNSVTIPTGFKIASDSAEDVTGGVVIEDATYEATIGSQFVWIPVGTGENAIKKSDGTTVEIELNRYTFAEDGTPSVVSNSNYRTEDTASSHSSRYGNAIAKDIEAFKSSANNNHGYYMGRYEAGTDTQRTSSSDTLTQVIVQKSKNVYNYVTQPQASSLSQNMYTSNSFTSDLINSYAWDTAIVFIQEFSGDKDYSRQTSLQSSLAKTGEATDGTNNDVRCNIYDMAGNNMEWTTETSSDAIYHVYYCVTRGGYYYIYYYYTSDRYSEDSSGSDGRSFRPLLYL